MQTIAWLVWLLAGLVIVGTTSNPLYIIPVLLASLLVYVACRPHTSNEVSYTWIFWSGPLLIGLYLIFGVMTVGGARGATVLITFPEFTTPPLLGGVTVGGPITAEDLLWGGVRGLRIWALLVIFGVFNALVDHYRLLRLAPRSLFHAGLIISLAVAFVPQTARAIAEIMAAQRLRGHRFRGPRALVALVSPLLAGSLERSIQLAEALDARGYARTQTRASIPNALRFVMALGCLLFCGGIFGWIYYGDLAGWAPPLIGVIGLVCLGFVLRAFGRLAPRSIYRRERRRPREVILILISTIGLVGWVVCKATGFGALEYQPYPLALPSFEWPVGLLTMLLAAPALFGPAPIDHSVRHLRARHTTRRRGAHAGHVEPMPFVVQSIAAHRAGVAGGTTALSEACVDDQSHSAGSPSTSRAAATTNSEPVTQIRSSGVAI